MRMLVMTSLVACGGAPSQPIGNKPVAPAVRTLVPCPAAEVDQLATMAYGRPAKGVACTPLWIAGKPYWWLLGDDNDGGGMWTMQSRALVAADRTVVWKHVQQKEEVVSGGTHDRNARAVDLDGDGSDEIVYDELVGEGGMSARSLHVVLFPTPAMPVLWTSLELENTSVGEGPSCMVDWETVAAGTRHDISVTTTCTNEAARVTRYRWTGKQFAEAK